MEKEEKANNEKVVNNVSSVSSHTEKEDEKKEKVNNKGLSVVNNVNNVNNVSYDINDKNDITYNLQGVAQALGFGVLDLILKILALKTPLSYQAISEQSDQKYDTVVQTMLRNKDFFKETEYDGKIKLFELSPSGKQYLKEKIETHEQKQDFSAKSLRKEEQRIQATEELILEVKTVTEHAKPSRDGMTLCFDFMKITEISPAVAEKLLQEPDNVIEAFNTCYDTDYHILFKNLPESSLICIEEIRPKHLNKLVTIEARAVSLSGVKPQIRTIKFECPSCGSITSVRQDLNVQQPNRCSCGRRGGFKAVDRELIPCSNTMLEDLQEKTDNPNLQRIRGLIHGDLTDIKNISIFTPGNEIKLVGIVREIPIFVRGQQSTFLNFVFEILYAKLFEPELSIENFSKKDIEEIIELAKKINEVGLSEINTSFAPDIYGYEQIKNALILQLCHRKNIPSKQIRNKPNILLIGDPSVGKSVLGKFSLAITPGSRKAVGGGSSAVGLTASVNKVDENLGGGWSIESGALILAKELLFLDELNNIKEEDKPKLQEGMSEQTVTINKANQHMSLRVTAGILAAANPRYGTFKSNESIIYQFNIPSPIISRFDEIFIMKDQAKEDRDKKVAKIVIERERQNIKAKYSKEFLRKFFVYVRKFIEPEIDEAVSEQMQNVYVQIRKEKTESLVIDPRFNETLIRLVKASAKIRLSKYIDGKDIKRALEILRESHFQISQYRLFDFQENKSGPLIPSDPKIPEQLQDDKLGIEADKLLKREGE